MKYVWVVSMTEFAVDYSDSKVTCDIEIAVFDNAEAAVEYQSKKLRPGLRIAIQKNLINSSADMSQ